VCLALDPRGGDIVFTMSDEGMATLRRAETGVCLLTLGMCRSWRASRAWIGSLQLFARTTARSRSPPPWTTWPGCVRSTESGECIGILQGHMDAVNSAVFAPAARKFSHLPEMRQGETVERDI